MDRDKNTRTQLCIPVEAAGHYSFIKNKQRCRIHDNYGLQFLKFLLVFLQAEIAMRADGKPGMSDEEVRSLTEPLWNPRLIDWLSDVVCSSNHFYFIHLKLKPT